MRKEGGGGEGGREGGKEGGREGGRRGRIRERSRRWCCISICITGIYSMPLMHITLIPLNTV